MVEVNRTNIMRTRLDSLTIKSIKQGTLTARDRSIGGGGFIAEKKLRIINGIKCLVEKFTDGTYMILVRDGSDPYALATSIGGTVVGDNKYIRVT